MAEKIQKDYEELKRKSELTEKFIKLANKLEIDDKDIPKTEKGMETKVKELMERLEKKLDKKEHLEDETHYWDGKRRRLRKEKKLESEEKETETEAKVKEIMGRLKKPLEDETHYWDGKRRRLRKRK